MESFDVGSEGSRVGVDEPALRWRGLGKGVDVDRGLAVHRRDDREVLVGAGDRPHTGLIEQDLVDVDSRKGLGSAPNPGNAVPSSTRVHAAANRAAATQHQRARRYRHP